MDLLQLPDELIPNISLYLPLTDVNNLIRSHVKFVNGLDFNWNLYIKIHLSIDVKLDKNDIITYSELFIEDWSNHYFIPAILSNLIGLDADDISFYEHRQRTNNKNLKRKLLGISDLIEQYKNCSFYHRLFQNNAPIFLYRQYFIAQYVGHSAIKTKGILNDNLGKIIVIKDKLVINDHDDFGQEVMDTIKTFVQSHQKEIIVIMIDQ